MRQSSDRLYGGFRASGFEYRKRGSRRGRRQRPPPARSVVTKKSCASAPPQYHIEHPMPGAIPARPADTAPDAERVQVALLRAAPVARRLHLALALSATIIGAARRALARARPHASARELDLRFVELHYGADAAAGLRADLDRRDTTPRPGA